ncbi:MAG: FAD-dependent oxidoreductase [Rhodobacterales bacterium]|nr:MAG: FAD-dependent oxidoreductase [Rhodobacterales bacterium]
MTHSDDQNQTAKLSWRDQLPISAHFDDPYFSLHNGLAETRHVFLAGNDLPGRFCPGFRVAELGFGTGLNMLASLQLWRAAGIKGRLHFTSFEAYPMQAADMNRALAAFPEIHDLAQPFLQQWDSGARRIETDDLLAEIIIGDARSTVPEWGESADAWYLDGFSPAKNPELWDEALLQSVADHTAPNGTFATYTAAGFVRRALAAAGFAVQRVKGFGHKRHMTVGQLAK